MTPQEILELSEPLEAVYTDTVTQLIANICKRLGEGKELPNWQAKKLAELDALTDESIQIISRMTGRRDAEIRNAISKALNIELKDVEAVLTGAAAAGAIAGIGFTVEESQGLKSMAQALIDQAETRANLVNTVMLKSTRQRYIWAVNSTADREQKLIEQLYSARNYEELEAQLSKVQAALNKAAGSVEVGAEARVQALSRTVKELAQEGITGYIDRGGHHWSPEAYMNMDIRTTVHNTAVQAQKTRAEEYGVETFQISSHGGARPLCAPYQGKFYSWDGSSGVVHDLRGNEYFYESIYDTSYGEPAGIFGINCGHNPQTFVDGYNIPRYEETSDFEANAEEYRESQKQRYFEREVRQAKLEAIAQDAAGNKDAFNQAAAKVRQANANYKEFCKETGRTPRPDRLQVYASPDGQGYNRSMSGKVTGTTRGWKSEERSQNIVTIKTDVEQFRNAAVGASNKIEFWMNFSESQQAAFKSSGLSIDELFDMVKESTTTSEWKAPNAGGPESFAIKHDFSKYGVRFEEVMAKSEGWMADANDRGTIRVRQGGLGEDWDFIISHEAGHQLSNISHELQQTIIDNPGNVLGRYNTKKLFFDGVYGEYNPEEAFATCVSNYVRHPESFKKKYPEAYQAIDNLFNASPSAMDYVEKVRTAYMEKFGK